MKLRLHVFSNGNTIFEFNDISPSQLDYFRTQIFLANPTGALMFQGVDLTIIEHMNPLAFTPRVNPDVDQDQQD